MEELIIGILRYWPQAYYFCIVTVILDKTPFSFKRLLSGSYLLNPPSRAPTARRLYLPFTGSIS